MSFPYETLSGNLSIREWLNGSVLPLSVNLTLIIGIFLWQSYYEARARKVKWRHMSGVPTGCALWWLFFAESIRSGFVWYILRSENAGRPISPEVEYVSDIGFMVAVGVLILTMLRASYIFTPPRWGHGFWIYSAISTLALLMLSRFCLTLGL